MALREWVVGLCVGVPTCYLLRGVSGDPFFIPMSPVSEASYLNMPHSRGLKVKSVSVISERNSPAITYLDPFAEGCFTAVLCGFWVAPFLQTGACLILWSSSGLGWLGWPGYSVHAPVQLQMPGEVTERNKALAADVTGEGPLCAMQQPVALEVALVAEELATLQAREWLLSSMDQHMPFQVSRRTEQLLAFRAAKNFLPTARGAGCGPASCLLALPIRGRFPTALSVAGTPVFLQGGQLSIQRPTVATAEGSWARVRF